MKPSAVFGKHLKACCARRIGTEEMEILASSSRSETYLFTLEALHIRTIRPTINTKDECKRRELTIKLYLVVVRDLISKLCLQFVNVLSQ